MRIEDVLNAHGVGVGGKIKVLGDATLVDSAGGLFGFSNSSVAGYARVRGGKEHFYRYYHSSGNIRVEKIDELGVLVGTYNAPTGITIIYGIEVARGKDNGNDILYMYGYDGTNNKLYKLTGSNWNELWSSATAFHVSTGRMCNTDAQGNVYIVTSSGTSRTCRKISPTGTILLSKTITYADSSIAGWYSDFYEGLVFCPTDKMISVWNLTTNTIQSIVQSTVSGAVMVDLQGNIYQKGSSVNYFKYPALVRLQINVAHGTYGTVDDSWTYDLNDNGVLSRAQYDTIDYSNSIAVIQGDYCYTGKAPFSIYGYATGQARTQGTAITESGKILFSSYDKPYDQKGNGVSSYPKKYVNYNGKALLYTTDGTDVFVNKSGTFIQKESGYVYNNLTTMAVKAAVLNNLKALKLV